MEKNLKERAIGWLRQTENSYNLDLIVVNSEELEKDIFIRSLLKNSVRRYNSYDRKNFL